jgi:hypothetical protein
MPGLTLAALPLGWRLAAASGRGRALGLRGRLAGRLSWSCCCSEAHTPVICTTAAITQQDVSPVFLLFAHLKGNMCEVCRITCPSEAVPLY